MSIQPDEPARDESARTGPAPGAHADAAAKGERPAGAPDRPGPSTNRIVIWVVVAGIALYLIGSGLYGILVK